MRFSVGLAAGLLGFGIALAVLGIVLIVLNGPESGVPVLFAAFVGTVMGGCYFGPLPYGVVTNEAIKVPTMVGPASQVMLWPGDRLDASGSRLTVVRTDGARVKAPLYRIMARPQDWAALHDFQLSRR